jgi:hypothetical protein
MIKNTGDILKQKMNPAKGALWFAVLLGMVSLFGDMTYEAARSINGPYLAILGARAPAVGIIAGLGELGGYGLRLISGYVSDKTQRYWLITIFGYAVNLHDPGYYAGVLFPSGRYDRVLPPCAVQW